PLPGKPRTAIAVGGPCLLTMNIDDPAHPQTVTWTVPNGDARDVVIGTISSSRFAFVADATLGVRALPFSDWFLIGLGSVFPPDGSFQAVAISGDRLAAAGRPIENHLAVPIYDLNPPANNRRLIDFGSVFGDTLQEKGTGIAMDANYVYFTTS